MPPVSSGLKKRVRAKLSILAKLQGVLATTRRERRSDDQLVEEEVEQVKLQTPHHWAESFETLISDSKGCNAFTLFLRKEYSEENMQFWTACCEYKAITDEAERKERAEEIYNRYLSDRATTPINIDSLARKQIKEDLLRASDNIFDHAKTQIYILMKTDSYRRFLKSDLSKIPVELAEPSHHQPLVIGQWSVSDASLSNEGHTTHGAHRDSPPSEERRTNSQEGTDQSSSNDKQDSLLSKETTKLYSTSRAKLEGRSACLGSRLDSERLLANIQANTAALPTEEMTAHNNKTEQIVTPATIDKDKKLNSFDKSNLHQPLGRSKSDNPTSPCLLKGSSKCMTLPKGQPVGSAAEPNISAHDHLSASTPNYWNRSLILGMLPSDSESSDEEVCNGGSKSFYLLRRLSHSLDHMIELEQAGIHSSNLASIRELNDKMEYEALPSFEIERFLNTAESFTCQSTCSCSECQQLKVHEELASGCSPKRPHIPIDCETSSQVSELRKSVPDKNQHKKSEIFCTQMTDTVAENVKKSEKCEVSDNLVMSATTDLIDVCKADLIEGCRGSAKTNLTNEGDPVIENGLKSCTNTFIDDLNIQPANTRSLTT
ncbi:uncharacterized protein [Watersipora subatra]|uniref:uncharacterized protein n=1 Tax=Watersipora subatra TaxID=2589382 RepID=UPI00355BDB0F